MSFLTLLRQQLDDLTTRRTAAVADMERTTAAATAENRAALTDDETTAFNAAVEAVRSIDAEIEPITERIAELEKLERNARDASPRIFNVNGGALDDPYDIELRTAPRTPEVVRDTVERAKRIVETDQVLNDEQRGRVDTLLRRHDRGGALARHIVTTGRPAYRSAFAKLVGQTHPVLTEDEARALEEVRALQITTDASGGFAVPFVLDPTIILTNNGAVNPIRSLATVKQVISDNWQGISTAGVTAAYGAESSVVGDGTPTLAQPSVTIRKAHAFIPFTIEAEQDWGAMNNDLAEVLGDAKDRLEATVFATGAAASNQPIGIITAAVAASLAVASTTTDTYAVGDVYKLQQALPARWRPNAQWLMSLPVINLTRQFGTAVGHAFLTDLAGGVPPLLLGQGLNELSTLDDTINASADNYIAVYGDLSGYHIHERVGMTIERVEHLFDPTTGRPTGERGWYAHWRNGANLVAPSVRVLNVT